MIRKKRLVPLPGTFAGLFVVLGGNAFPDQWGDGMAKPVRVRGLTEQEG